MTGKYHSKREEDARFKLHKREEEAPKTKTKIIFIDYYNTLVSLVHSPEQTWHTPGMT